MNMQNLMAQAQKMQRDIQQKKEEINKKVFIGKSEMVTVEVMGNKTIKKILITNDDIINKDDKEILEDMILLSINDALNQIDKEVENKLGQYSQSLNGLI